MYRRDYRDIISGLLLVLVGGAVGGHAWLNYPMGTLRHMGPGMFPTWLGLLLLGIGVLVLLPALIRAGPRLERPHIRPFLMVIGGGVAFAYVVTTFGMVPAVVVLTVLAILADDKLGLVGTLTLCIVLSLIAVAIFSYGLKVPLQPFRWPF